MVWRHDSLVSKVTEYLFMTFSNDLSYYKEMHKLSHFFIIYLINKIVNLHISLLVICVSSSFVSLINNCQASTLQGQVPQLKCWEPVPPCLCGSYSPALCLHPYKVSHTTTILTILLVKESLICICYCAYYNNYYYTQVATCIAANFMFGVSYTW